MRERWRASSIWIACTSAFHPTKHVCWYTPMAAGNLPGLERNGAMVGAELGSARTTRARTGALVLRWRLATHSSLRSIAAKGLRVPLFVGPRIWIGSPPSRMPASPKRKGCIENRPSWQGDSAAQIQGMMVVPSTQREVNSTTPMACSAEARGSNDRPHCPCLHGLLVRGNAMAIVVLLAG